MHRVWTCAVLAAALVAGGCKSKEEPKAEEEIPKGGQTEALIKGADNEGRLWLKNPGSPEAPKAEPAERGAPAEKAPAPEKDAPRRLAMTLAGQKVDFSPAGGIWVCPEPVPEEPTLRFTTTLDPVRRVIINIFECDSQGALTEATPISIIDTRGRTLLPDRAINPAAPEGCMIWQDRTLQRVPFRPGRYYRVGLTVKSDSDTEVLGVLFRVQ